MKIRAEELRQALKEVREEELNLLLKACENKDIEQRIESSKKRVNQQEIHRLAHKKQRWDRWSRIVAAILILSLVGTVSAYAMEKVHQAIVNWNANLGENEDDFHFNVENPARTASPKGNEETPTKIERRYHLTYIKEGFHEHGEDWQEQSYRIIYKKKKERIRFEQLTKTEKTTADLGLTDQETLVINGYKGQYGHKGTESILRFVTEMYVFQLSTKASVERDEMIRMAESVAVMPPDKIDTYYSPKYIPDGYLKWEDGYVRNDLDYVMYYAKNKNQFLTFNQTTMAGTSSIDSENAKRKEITVNGWKGQLNYAKKKKTIIWATDEYVFTVSGVGDISEEELLKVAKSITSEN